MENLLLVKEVKERFWGFENLSLCPYDQNLIERRLLVDEEVE